MKHEINELWRVQEGSRVVWKLQAPKGILTCKTKREAVAWQTAYSNYLKEKKEKGGI